MFLLWAIAQERLSVPFKRIDGTGSDKFKSALVIGTVQSALSCIAAFIYIFIRRPPGQTMSQALGITSHIASAPITNGNGHTNGTVANGHTKPTSSRTKTLLLLYLQCSLFITLAAPFGFASLSYISYPAMVLGKSCKLVPVMLMNVLLYRRKFAPHKYLVVGMVTLGITIFMFFGNSSKSHGAHASSSSKEATTQNPTPYASLIGLTYLLINLALDGLTNSTQDEIFTTFRSSGITGQQMMFFINLFCTLITTLLCLLPLPYIPAIHPSYDKTPEVMVVAEFLRTHGGVGRALVQFAVTGAMGQLFIFETLQHFGSLTLVTITLTRKMFTMILSVVVYNHKLTPGQWVGAGVVFAGISVEAFVKKKSVHPKKIAREEEKPQIKEL